MHGLGLWAPLGHIVLFALATILFVPGAIFGLLGGVLFGPFWGTALNLAGATLGAAAAFLVARYVAADWVRLKASGRLDRLITGVEAEGWRFVAFVLLVPLFPFNLTNYALGLTRISLKHYVLASLACMVPGTLAYTWLGHAGREAAAGNMAAIRYGLIALALLAAIAFLPRLLRRLRPHAVWRIRCRSRNMPSLAFCITQWVSTGRRSIAKPARSIIGPIGRSSDPTNADSFECVMDERDRDPRN